MVAVEIILPAAAQGVWVECEGILHSPCLRLTKKVSFASLETVGFVHCMWSDVLALHKCPTTSIV